MLHLRDTAQPDRARDYARGRPHSLGRVLACLAATNPGDLRLHLALRGTASVTLTTLAVAHLLAISPIDCADAATLSIVFVSVSPTVRPPPCPNVRKPTPVTPPC